MSDGANGWAELAAAVEGRDHWTHGAGTVLPADIGERSHPPAVAWYEPDEAGRWIGRVQLASMPDRRYHRFHVAILRGGVAAYTHWANTAAEAVRLAEQHTDAQLRES